jgi:hypothetical protein
LAELCLQSSSKLGFQPVAKAGFDQGEFLTQVLEKLVLDVAQDLADVVNNDLGRLLKVHAKVHQVLAHGRDSMCNVLLQELAELGIIQSAIFVFHRLPISLSKSGNKLLFDNLSRTSLMAPGVVNLKSRLQNGRRKGIIRPLKGLRDWGYLPFEKPER